MMQQLRLPGSSWLRQAALELELPSVRDCSQCPAQGSLVALECSPAFNLWTEPELYANSLPAPLPQLPPSLDEDLHLLRRGQPVVDEAAVLIRALVEVADGARAQM